MQEGSAYLVEELRGLALREGAMLFGVAGVDRFDGAPRGHHLADIVKSSLSVISIGVPLVEQVTDWDQLFQQSEFFPPDIRKPVLQDYLYGEVNYRFINERLNQVALSLTLFLQARGFRSTLFPATFGHAWRPFEGIAPHLGMFSNRHAAVRAGLGEVGLNNVVVTPEYGPRVRFNSVITQAELEPSLLLKEKVCRGANCGACVDQCGGGAISLPSEAMDESRVWLNPVSRTDMGLCQEKRGEAFCYGRCLKVCPVGRHTS